MATIRQRLAVAGGPLGVGHHQRGRAGHPRLAHDQVAGGDDGGRRAELCALVYSDLDGDRLTIDSSIAIERTGSVIDRQVPALVDAATKTGNQRVVRLDERTVQAIEALRRERERYGPWMLQPGSGR